MSFTHRNSVNYQSTAIGSQSKSYTQSADSETNFSDTITTTNSSTFEVVMNIPVLDQVKSMFFLSAGDATVKFYEAGTPTNLCTIALTDAVPLIWSADHTETNPALGNETSGTEGNRDTVAIATSGTSITLNATILHNAPGA